MKTCQTCKAWGPIDTPAWERSTAIKGLCCRSALVLAHPDGEITRGCKGWCLDHVPIEDEQGVLDNESVHVDLDRLIQSLERNCHKAGEFADSIRVVSMTSIMRYIEEERNRDHSQ